VTSTLTIKQQTLQILALAQEVHRLLGGGWAEAVYRDAILILCEECSIPCRRAAGVRGAGPVRAAIVCFDSILVRCCQQFPEGRGLRHSLVAAGLDRAVLLRFDDGDVVSQIVTVDAPVHMAMAVPPRPVYSE